MRRRLEWPPLSDSLNYRGFYILKTQLLSCPGPFSGMCFCVCLYTALTVCGCQPAVCQLEEDLVFNQSSFCPLPPKKKKKSLIRSVRVAGLRVKMGEELKGGEKENQIKMKSALHVELNLMCGSRGAVGANNSTSSLQGQRGKTKTNQCGKTPLTASMEQQMNNRTWAGGRRFPQVKLIF